MNNTDRWLGLFAGNIADSHRYRLSTLSRHGQPFLYLPSRATAAIATLALYPAQRSKARIAKAGLVLALKLRLPLPLPKLSVDVDPNAPFTRFLTDVGGGAPGSFPVWGMLAGNPNAPGQRLIFLVFDKQLKPVAVVKAGQGDTARRLITQEMEALAALPPGLAGAPRLLGQWEDSSAAALALPYIAGHSPSSESLGRVAEILADWLRFGSELPLDSLAGWRAVLNSGCELPWPSPSITVRAPVTHGDFAPWNIKVSADNRDQWTVIDWERGERHGVPAWDWFHFVLQSAVLVEKASAETLAERAETLLASPAFQTYAEAAQIRGLKRVLLLGYLVHCTEVIRQAEGAPAISGARALLMERWR